MSGEQGGRVVTDDHVSLARRLEPIPVQSCDSCVSRCTLSNPKSLRACCSWVALRCDSDETPLPLTPCTGPLAPVGHAPVPRSRVLRAGLASGMLQASWKTYFAEQLPATTRKTKGSAEKRSVRVWTGLAGRSSCRVSALLLGICRALAGKSRTSTRAGEPGQESHGLGTPDSCMLEEKGRAQMFA